MTNPEPRARSGQVNVFFSEGYFDCCLRIDELIQLQEKRGSGPAAILNRLHTQSWLVEDIIEVIRLGLIGGGMGKQEAYDLVRRSVVSGSVQEHVVVAYSILIAALIGSQDDEPSGEPEAAPTTATTEEDWSDGPPISS